ncbi:hypothetical protein AWB78_04910 [Caballeronia calidae]|uniref:Uncharacterized protein n=1 Tax=Caballeronia calidae TaxID=1777139 RepID=A0A158DAD0_9BURK|nr:hypothetical protein [Caballeronia calidae]SAK91320.1 hypothetical protein AWB78_04910 [Caballeronia calidae]
MFTLEDDEFECYSCGTVFKGIVLGVTVQWERVYYMRDTRMVAAKNSFRWECYCSTKCREARLKQAMRALEVPIPAVPPGLGPIEVCARCRGPVDMTQFHRAYVEDEVETDGVNSNPIDVNYLAVVCKACDPWNDDKVQKWPEVTPMEEVPPKSNPFVTPEGAFTPTSYLDFRIRAMRLRRAVGNGLLSRTRAYQLFSQICGYQSFQQLRRVLVSGNVPEPVWDSQLSDIQLAMRRQAQIAVLVSTLPTSEAEAANLIDIGGFSSRPQQRFRPKRRPLHDLPGTERIVLGRGSSVSTALMPPAAEAHSAGAWSSIRSPTASSFAEGWCGGNGVTVAYRKRRKVQLRAQLQGDSVSVGGRRRLESTLRLKRRFATIGMVLDVDETEVMT